MSTADGDDVLEGEERAYNTARHYGGAFKPGTACEHEIEVRVGEDG